MPYLKKLLLTLLFTLTWTSNIGGNFPILDVDTNMRIVLVPHDMPLGIAFYRIKATDSDRNFPLTFEVMGPVGSTLLTLKTLGCSEAESLCQADVFLKKALDPGRTYEFQLRVTDTMGDFTRVKAAISATQGSAYVPSLLGPKSLTIPENTAVGSKLASFIVLKNELNSRMVLLEIREPEGRIELRQRLLSNNRTEGSLYLKKKLDFESEPWFTFQLLAMNGHTNISVDTRNVLVSDVVIGVEDSQDTPPIFTSFTSYVEIELTMRKGDLITHVSAVDGDRRNKHVIRYGILSEANPFVGFFDLDPMSGEITLKRDASELAESARPNEHIVLSILAEEIVPPAESPTGLSRFRRSGHQNTRTVQNITFWFRQSHSPIKKALHFSSQKYIGEIEENAPIGSLVRFSLESKVFSTGSDTIVALSLEDVSQGQGSLDKGQRSIGQDAFDVVPEDGHGNFTFELRVLRPELLDFEQKTLFKFKLRAISTSGLNATASIHVFIRDENDCKPEFSKKEYTVDLPENSPSGTSVVQVVATDCDTSGGHGTVTYAQLAGSEPFVINPLTGEISVDNPGLLDRETQSEFRFYVTATDGSGSGDESNAYSKSAVRNVGVTMVTVTLLDENDSAPKFTQPSYQVVLTPDLSRLKWPLEVQATDADRSGTSNAQVRYKIVDDSHFGVDAVTGVIRVKSKLSPSGDSPYLGTVTVQAYDRGLPAQSSEATLEVFSEDVLTQDIQFLFPTPFAQVKMNERRIAEMLSALIGGHAEIKAIDPYKGHEGKVKVKNLKIEERQERLRKAEDESDEEEATEQPEKERQRKSDAESTEKTVVSTRVNTPLAGKSRVFDLSELKTFMIIDDTRETTTTPSEVEKTVKAESHNIFQFWLLISLIVLLLILVMIFLICIFCPCCWYSRSNRHRSKVKSEKSTNQRRATDRSFEVAETEGQKSSRKSVHTVLENDADYNPSLSRFPRAREAWSGDERLERRGRNRLRQIDANQLQSNANYQRLTQGHYDRDEVEDFDVGLRHADTLPAKFVRHRDELSPRWRHGEARRGAEWFSRNRVADVPDATIAYGRHGRRNDGYYGDRASEYGGGNYGYQTSERRAVLQYSPPHSLPPGPPSADYRARSQRHPHQRFFRTDAGEVLQFDFDGDEGKEMLMRRFMQDQRHTRENDARQNQCDDATVSRPQIEHARIHRSHAEGRHHAHAEEVRKDSEVRPKAAAGSRRHLHAGQEIPELPEEDEVTREEEPKNRRKESKRHKEASRTKSHSKSKDRSRSRESDGGHVSPPVERPRKKRQNSKSPNPPLLIVEGEPAEGQSSGQRSRASKVTDKSPSPRLISKEVQMEEERIEGSRNLRLESAEVGPFRLEGGEFRSGVSTLLLPDDLDRLLREEDEDSGIGIAGMAQRNRMLEKKSVFTIAYDEMATQNVLRPDTALNNGS